MALRESYFNKLDFSILDRADSADRPQLASLARELIVGKGDWIQRSATPAEVFLVISGEISLRSEVDPSQEYGRVIAGRTIELKSLFQQVPSWRYGWRAEVDSRIVVLPWRELHESLKKNRKAYDYLCKVTVSVEIQKLRRDLRAFGFDQRSIEEVVSAMDNVSLKELGGDSPSERYFLLMSSGYAELKVDLDSGFRSLCRFQVGDHFVFDPRDSRYLLESGGKTQVWLLPETEWKNLGPRELFERFLLAHNPLTLLHRGPEVNPADEITQNEAVTQPLGTSTWQMLKSGVLRQLRTFLPQPLHVQPDPSWAGAVCLMMVGHRLGFALGLNRLRDAFAGTDRASQLLNVAKVARLSGFRTEIKKFPLSASFHPRWPVIIVSQSRPIVLYSISGEDAVIYDPEVGSKNTVFWKRLSRHWNGDYLEIRPTFHSRDLPEKPTRFLWYAGAFKGSLYTCLLVVLTTSITFLFALTIPMFNQYIFEHVLIEKNFEAAKVVTVLYFVCSSFLAIFVWVGKVLDTDVNSTLEAKFTSAYMQHLVRVPLNLFDSFTKGDALDRLEEAKAISAYLAGDCLRVFASLLILALCSLIMYYYHPRLLVAAVGLVPALVLIARLLAPRIYKLNLMVSRLKARDRNMIVQSFDNLETLRLANALRSERWKWEANYIKGLKLVNSLAITDGFFTFSRVLMEQLTKIWVLGVGVGLYAVDEITIGKMIASTFLIDRLSAPFWSIVQTLYKFPAVKASASRVQPVFQTEAERVAGEPVDVSEMDSTIVFENVSFAYGKNAENVLENVNLTIKKGEIVTLLGSNGSGKSTLASLMNGTRKPTSGRILVGGKDMESMHPATVRQIIGTIQQDATLLKASLFENVTLGDATATQDRALAAIYAASADDLLTKLPKGLSTMIGAGGNGLSAGQIQKIMLARMMYHNPEVFVMDESISFLDPISQEQTMARFFATVKGKTVVMVSHQIGLLSRSTKVVLVQDKRVVASGTHQDLILSNPRYFEFFSGQLVLSA